MLYPYNKNIKVNVIFFSCVYICINKIYLHYKKINFEKQILTKYDRSHKFLLHTRLHYRNGEDLQTSGRVLHGFKDHCISYGYHFHTQFNTIFTTFHFEQNMPENDAFARGLEAKISVFIFSIEYTHIWCHMGSNP